MAPLNSRSAKILFEDGFSVEKGTGVGRYTRNLAEGLREAGSFELLDPPPRNLLRSVRPAGARRALYSAWLETIFQYYLIKMEPEIIHFTNYLIPRTRRSKSKYVSTIHDLVAWRVPQSISPVYGRYIRSAVARTAEIADLILCPSHAIRSEVVENFGVDDRKVLAIPVAPAVPTTFSSAQYEVLSARLRRILGLRTSFLLFVGTLEYRKNLTTLVKGFAQIAKLHDLQLVMIGRRGYRFEDVQSLIAQQTFPDRYVIPGFVTDEELSALYRMAEAFVYPSLYEGFGIPLVEAMSLGLPVIASKIPSSEEIGADAILYYGQPLDASALAETITQVITQPNLKAELIQKGKKRAGEFSAEKIIKQYEQAYRSILT